MAFTGRDRSSSLFIISEGQFYSKPSLKLERLEKDYSDLKRKEHGDEIELRRLRTETLLLKQRIDNLEKESATLADKLVQDKVAWAQEVEQLYAVRTRLSITLRQLRESQNQLHDAENTADELSKKNQVCTDQIRRVGANNKELKKFLEEITQEKKMLQTQINMLTRKLDDAESTRQEEAILARIKDAENMQQMAELRRKIAEMDIQKVEQLAMGQICDRTYSHPRETSSRDLQDQHPLQYQLIVPGVCVHHGHQGLADSPWADHSNVLTDCQWAGGNSDDEFDALVKDSENLERTLSDIVEGKHNSATTLTYDSKEGLLSDARHTLLESDKSDRINCAPKRAYRQTKMTALFDAGICVSRQLECNAVVGIGNVDATSDKNMCGVKTVGVANIDDSTYGKGFSVVNVDDSTDEINVGLANVCCADDTTNGKPVGVANVDTTHEKTAGVANVDDTTHEKPAGVANVDDTTHEKTVGVANVDDTTREKPAGVATVDDITHEKTVCVSNDDTIDKKIIVVADASCAATIASESRSRGVDEMEHNEIVYESPGGASSVMYLFRYKDEVDLMLKESTV